MFQPAKQAIDFWRRSGFTSMRDNVNLATMKATSREPEIVTRNGKPVSVIIPIKDYQELLERAEDAEDVAWLKRARRKKLYYRPLEDYLAERRTK
jgi:prevent-host-death family protein